MRLRPPPLRGGWLAWSLVIAFAIALACVPWWVGVPLLLGIAAIQLAHVSRVQRYAGTLRYALRWGLGGLLVASYRAYDDHKLGLTLTLLAALVGFSLLVLLESWQDRKPQRNAAAVASSPEWSELALAPIGPADTLIELDPPHWQALGDDRSDALPPDITRLGTGNYRVGNGALIKDVEAPFSMAPGKGWLAWHMAARRGVVLYDRARGVQYRLRGWQLYGWHVDEAWLSRSDDQPPSALSHVLGQDLREE